MAKLDINAFIEQLKEMTILELNELVKAIEEEFGVTAAAPVAAAGPVAVEEEGPTSFDVVLKNAGTSKIPVIKVVREVTGLGLKDAKDLVDSAPKAVKEGLSEDEAKELKEKLEAVGATVELK